MASEEDLEINSSRIGVTILILLALGILGFAGWYAYQTLYYINCPALVNIPTNLSAGVGYDINKSMIVVNQHSELSEGAIRTNFTVDDRCLEMVKHVNETTGETTYDLRIKVSAEFDKPSITWAKVKK